MDCEVKILINWLIKFLLFGLFFVGVDKADIFKDFMVLNAGWAFVVAAVVSIFGLALKISMKTVMIPERNWTYWLFGAAFYTIVLALTDGVIGSDFDAGSAWHMIVISLILSLGGMLVDKILSFKK